MNAYAIESIAIPAIEVEELTVEHITLSPIDDITEWLEQEQEDAELNLLAYEMRCSNKLDIYDFD